MIKLYGFAVSNYYNMVKLALLEKGVPFEEVPFFAGQTPQALAISPRGKVILRRSDASCSECSLETRTFENTFVAADRKLLSSQTPLRQICQCHQATGAKGTVSHGRAGSVDILKFWESTPRPAPLPMTLVLLLAFADDNRRPVRAVTQQCRPHQADSAPSRGTRAE